MNKTDSPQLGRDIKTYFSEEMMKKIPKLANPILMPYFAPDHEGEALLLLDCFLEMSEVYILKIRVIFSCHQIFPGVIFS